MIASALAAMQSPAPIATASTGVPVWIAIVAAAIGAGGAVLAQIVAQAFTSRRERERFQWEVAHAEAEDKRRKTELLFETKRTLFTEVVLLANRRNRWLREQYGDEDFASKQSLEESFAWDARWDALTAELAILDYDVANAMTAFAIDFTLAELMPAADTPETNDKVKTAAYEEFRRLSEIVRSSIGLHDS